MPLLPDRRAEAFPRPHGERAADSAAVTASRVGNKDLEREWGTQGRWQRPGGTVVGEPWKEIRTRPNISGSIFN